jgi:hypothetical protein
MKWTDANQVFHAIRAGSRQETAGNLSEYITSPTLKSTKVTVKTMNRDLTILHMGSGASLI